MINYAMLALGVIGIVAVVVFLVCMTFVVIADWFQSKGWIQWRPE